MTRVTTHWFGVLAAALAPLLLIANAAAGWEQDEKAPRKTSPRTAEEVVPGVPLDGSIIIDESVWLSLLGEPGKHMADGYEHFTKGNLSGSAESIHKAASFLNIASDNAFKGPNEEVQKSAIALNELHRRVAAQEVTSPDELKSVFSDAHLAMSRHHAAKSANALKKREWQLSGNYLRSAAVHLQRASFWAGRELRPDTKETVTDAKLAARRLIEEGGKSVEKAGQLIEILGKRIERLGKALAEPKPDDPDSK